MPQTRPRRICVSFRDLFWFDQMNGPTQTPIHQRQRCRHLHARVDPASRSCRCSGGDARTGVTCAERLADCYRKSRAGRHDAVIVDGFLAARARRPPVAAAPTVVLVHGGYRSRDAIRGRRPGRAGCRFPGHRAGNPTLVRVKAEGTRQRRKPKSNGRAPGLLWLWIQTTGDCMRPLNHRRCPRTCARSRRC